MESVARRAAASRDGHLALRRVERQQALIESVIARGRTTAGELAALLEVSERTIERDIERLRDAGVPFATRRGRGGGISLTAPRGAVAVVLDAAEIAALLSSLAAVGPNASLSATSAAAKLVMALDASER